MPLNVRRDAAVLLLAALALGACVPNRAIQTARAAPAGSSQHAIFVSADRFGVTAQRAGAADDPRIFGVIGFGDESGIGMGKGQELVFGFRFSNISDIGMDLGWKAQWLGADDPDGLALALQADFATRIAFLPYDAGLSFLLAAPLGASDLRLNLRYGYLFTDAGEDPALSVTQGLEVFLPPAGAFWELQGAWDFHRGQDAPYLGLSARQYVDPVRRGATVAWAFDPVLRAELGMRFGPNAAQ